MKKLLLTSALAILSLGLYAQRIEEAPSSTFGLDEKDAKAVTQIRARMAWAYSSTWSSTTSP